MTGESTFTYDTLESQKIKNPNEYMNAAQNMEDTSKAVSRYVTGGPVVGLNQFQKQQGLNDFLKEEFARRKAASTGAASIAGMIDTRLTGAANELFTAENKAINAEADAAQKQAQALTLSEYEKKAGLQPLTDRKREIDWTLEKNQTTRNDKIEDAYVEGTVENRMIDLAIEGALRLQDIDQYYKLQTNEIDQTFEDWKVEQEIDFNQAIAKAKASSAAFATMFDGLMGIVFQFTSTLTSGGNQNG